MSNCRSTLTPVVAPVLVTAGKIYERAAAAGGGRFQALKVVKRAGESRSMNRVYQFDVWSLVHLGGDKRFPVGLDITLDEEEIFALTDECQVQPGQTWTRSGKHHVKTIKLTGCEVTPHGWQWNCEYPYDPGIRGGVMEDFLLSDFARVDGLDVDAAAAATVAAPPAAKPARETNGPCRACGSPALDLAFVIECSNSKCRNFMP